MGAVKKACLSESTCMYLTARLYLILRLAGTEKQKWYAEIVPCFFVKLCLSIIRRSVRPNSLRFSILALTLKVQDFTFNFFSTPKDDDSVKTKYILKTTLSEWRDRLVILL